MYYYSAFGYPFFFPASLINLDYSNSCAFLVKFEKRQYTLQSGCKKQQCSYSSLLYSIDNVDVHISTLCVYDHIKLHKKWIFQNINKIFDYYGLGCRIKMVILQMDGNTT